MFGTAYMNPYTFIAVSILGLKEGLIEMAKPP